MQRRAAVARRRCYGESMSAEAFGKLLREYRLVGGMTQEQLADRSGVSTRSISILEAGRRHPRLSSAARLAAGLALDPAARGRLLVAAHGVGATGGVNAVAGRVRPANSPRLLPCSVYDFIGRSKELARLSALRASQDMRSGAGVTVSVIDGMVGVGKTSLAIQAGRALAQDFPDGQIAIDLHGFTSGHQPVDTNTALTRLLWAVGVPSETLPEQAEERMLLWRSTTAGLRLLIVLDNAAAADQVRPLIPTGAGSLVLVTSRRRLPTLSCAVHISLDGLAPTEAESLFADIVGHDRIRGHDSAVTEIVKLCGYLPLTVRAAASRLAHRNAWAPPDLLARLRDKKLLLSELSAQDQDLAAALASSYTPLTFRHRHLLQQLAALCQRDGFTSGAVAALLQVPLPEAESLLNELYDFHLLHERVAGRYHLHDLVRAFALQQSTTTAGTTTEPNHRPRT